jgi:hypothetical protein
MKANTALAPLIELGRDIFCDENNVPGTANQVVSFRIGLGRVPAVDKGEVLIALDTAGVGSWDAEMRAGWYPKWTS